MAEILYKLGRWASEKRKKVMGGTLAIMLAMVILTISMGVSFDENMTIPGTESEKVGMLLEKEFGVQEAPEGGQVHLVFKAPENETLESKQIGKVIQDMLDDIKQDASVVSTATPVELMNLSEDKKIGYAVVTYKETAEEVSESSKEHILASIEQTQKTGIQTELAGTVPFSEMEIGGASEVVGVLVAFLVLALTFTSFLAAGMPIITAITGLGIGLLAILVGTNMLDISSVSLSLSAMLGLAVGIDYALFIISRYRQQLAQGYSVKDSIAIANATAGSAVVFAGLTVIIGLLGLSVAQVPFLTMMGISAAFCVLVAIFIAVIFVPAILGFLGERIGPARKNGFLKIFNRNRNHQEGSSKWGEFVTKRPFLVAIVGIVILCVISLPYLHMELGLPDNGMKSEETTERRAYDLLSEAYGPGYHASIIVVAKTSDGSKMPNDQMSEITEVLSGLPNVKSVSPAIPSPSANVNMISVTPNMGPNDTETKDVVNAIRGTSILMDNGKPIELMVTGATAVNIDISQKLNDALPLFAMLIVGLAFVLLVLVFRSLLVPLKAVLGFLLSLGATLGFVVFVLQDGNLIELFGYPAAGPVLNFLPVIVVGILFGLAMDYEVFLVSRIREVYTHTGDARKAIVAGMKDSGGVVTAAGLIMIAVFAGFMLAPDPIIKSMGLALTFGVLFDAFIVRLAIVPSVMSILGKSAWYLPRWLDRILPDVDIEGESIMKKISNSEDKAQQKVG